MSVCLSWLVHTRVPHHLQANTGNNKQAAAQKKKKNNNKQHSNQILHFTPSQAACDEWARQGNWRKYNLANHNLLKSLPSLYYISATPMAHPLPLASVQPTKKQVIYCIR